LFFKLNKFQQTVAIFHVTEGMPFLEEKNIAVSD